MILLISDLIYFARLLLWCFSYSNAPFEILFLSIEHKINEDPLTGRK